MGHTQQQCLPLSEKPFQIWSPPSPPGGILGHEIISFSIACFTPIQRERDEVKRTRAVFAGFPKRRVEPALSKRAGARWCPHT